AEARAKLEHGTGVGQGGDDGPDVVGPFAIGRHERPQRPLTGTVPWGQNTLWVRQEPPGDRRRLPFVGDEDVYNTVGELHLDRTHVIGGHVAKTPSGDHGRPTHADARSRG